MTITIGVISDTHDLLRPEAVSALKDSDLILHAGDLTDLHVIDTLSKYAPVHAVRGNMDGVSPLLPLNEVVEIEGARVGFAGGGITSIGTAGEVSEDTMEAKLGQLGPVDILCTHVPPAVLPLERDVIGGRDKGSSAVLEYIRRHQPPWHYYGDVHQPQASMWRIGDTLCRNVGYFRATGRAWNHS